MRVNIRKIYLNSSFLRPLGGDVFEAKIRIKGETARNKLKDADRDLLK